MENDATEASYGKNLWIGTSVGDQDCHREAHAVSQALSGNIKHYCNPIKVNARYRPWLVRQGGFTKDAS